MYLYASVSDMISKEKTGELFFYYIPKGILKKNPVKYLLEPIRTLKIAVNHMN